MVHGAWVQGFGGVTLEGNQASIDEEVEERLAEHTAPVSGGGKDAGGGDQELRAKVDSLFQAVQSRLEDLEAESGVGEDEERKSVGRSETERMIKIAVDDVTLRSERTRDEAFTKWKSAQDSELTTWKKGMTASVSKEAATETAKAVSAAIKDLTKDLPPPTAAVSPEAADASGAALESLSEEAVSSVAADVSGAALEYVSEEVTKLKAAAEEAALTEARFNDRLDDLLASMDEAGSCLKNLEGDHEEHIRTASPADKRGDEQHLK
ncbi:hypothetical protein T484DRAFT_1819730 [Baffinella frigidus]|nr:hypothetical protein T484DRAFT_1819730 [Cryptophyta sp. CCMP2293]